mgnify:CR=1 FL=1
MITFRVVSHKSKPTEVVEVCKDGEVVATIYGDMPNCDIQVISAHFAGELATETSFPKGVVMDNGSRWAQVPGVKMTFELRPYEIHVGSIHITRTTHSA